MQTPAPCSDASEHVTTSETGKRKSMYTSGRMIMDAIISSVTSSQRCRDSSAASAAQKVSSMQKAGRRNCMEKHAWPPYDARCFQLR